MLDENIKERIWLIAAVSAAISTLLPSIVFGLMWIIVSPIIFAVLCSITWPCLFIWHKIETTTPISKPVQFLLICFLGSMVGFLAYGILFQPQSFHQAVTGRGGILALSYALPGIISAGSAWLLYNFGPFRIYADKQSDIHKAHNKAELTPAAIARIIGYIIIGAALAWIFSDAEVASYVPDQALNSIEWVIKNLFFAAVFVIQPLIMITVIFYAGYKILKHIKGEGSG